MINRIMGNARVLEGVTLIDKMAKDCKGNIYLAIWFDVDNFIAAMKAHMKRNSSRWEKQNREVLEAVEQLKIKQEKEREDGI